MKTFACTRILFHFTGNKRDMKGVREIKNTSKLRKFSSQGGKLFLNTK